MNFVLDSNVWVSIFYRSKLEKVLSLLYSNDHNLITCTEQLY
jgi:predicted nucleic acid-binding protein